MAGRGPPPASGRRNRNFVRSWEELPAGEWLDNDENGTHWYQTSEGDYWHSTDEGYVRWNEEEQSQAEDTQPDVHPETEDDFEEDEEEDVKPKKVKPRRPPPEVGNRPGIIGFLSSLTVLAWTYFGTIPFTEKALERVDILDSQYDGWELFEAIYDLRAALERVLELNDIVMMVAGLTLLFSVLSFTRFTKWWLIPLSLTALLGLLGYTAWFEDAAQTEFVRACNEWTDCQPATPIWISNAMIASYCGGIAWIIIGLRVVGALMNREPVELEEDEDDFDFHDFYD